MPYDGCDFCCNLESKALSTNTYRLTVLLALCAMGAQAQPSEAAAVTSSVASSATSVNLLAPNAARKGVTIFNDSTQVLKIKYGATASSTDFTYSIAAAGVFNMPTPIYGGIIDGIWAVANGFARITEW